MPAGTRIVEVFTGDSFILGPRFYFGLSFDIDKKFWATGVANRKGLFIQYVRIAFVKFKFTIV